jgi:glycosyltransferase involved in cell wall biosynthesis
MKILHLSTSDLDGGGARAAYRLHTGLKAQSLDSRMLVRAKQSTDWTVIAEKSLLTKLSPPLSGLPLKQYPLARPGMFSSQWIPDLIAPHVRQINPDIVHLHWVCNGFLRIETLSHLSKPIVWTLHDMWPFTGGCHYAGECLEYMRSCGSCPQLLSNKKNDLSNWVWKRKTHSWKNLKHVIVSPSVWLAECAQASTLFKHSRIEVIPHGLDLNKFKPIDQTLARNILNLPPNKKLILFGASPGATGHSRKGLHLLQAALQKLSQTSLMEDKELVVFGTSQFESLPDLGFKAHNIGTFQDDISLSLVYSAADVMIVPSTQEAFGQTASESLACGTPVVAFAATGLKDIVTHKKNGYLAKPFQVDDLAQGIAWVLEEDSHHFQLSLNARQQAESDFSLELQASRYISLYKSLDILH